MPRSSQAASPAREATTGAVRSLIHWSSLIALAAVLPVAHWLASDQGGGDESGLVFAASFAVFALLLPAVGILREYVDRRTARLQEVIQRGDAAKTESLVSQQRMFSRLTKTVAALQRGIVLAVVAAIASSAGILAPDAVPWHGAPAYFSFGVREILTGFALVCLVGAIIAMFPFTWHLLVRADQLRVIEDAVGIALRRRAEQAAAAPADPAHPPAPAAPPAPAEGPAPAAPAAPAAAPDPQEPAAC